MIKNKLNLLFIITALCLLATSCGDDDDTSSTFRVIKTEIAERPEALSGTITLSSSDFEYKVNKEWCVVTKKDNILNIEAGTNYDFMNRTSEITITSGGVKYLVPVTQTGILLELDGNTNELYSFNQEGGERIVRILANVDFELIVPDEYKSWISYEPLQNGQFKIITEASTINREGNVYFQYLDKKVEIVINQYNYLSYNQFLGPATMYYTNTAGDRQSTQVTFVENIPNKVLNLVGTFESGVERTIAVSYFEEKDGEIRIHPQILDPNFKDPSNPKTGRLFLALAGTHLYTLGNKVESFIIYPTTAANLSRFYPGKADFILEGGKYKFAHSSEGVPDTAFQKNKNTQGLNIVGMETVGNIKTDLYDTLYDIEIIKE